MFSVDTAHSDAQSGDGLLEVSGGGCRSGLVHKYKINNWHVCSKWQYILELSESFTQVNSLASPSHSVGLS